MKLSLITGFALASGLVFASQVPNPLLTKKTDSGFVPPHLARTTTCNVYSNYVYIRTTKGTEAPQVKKEKIEFNNEVKSVGDIKALTKDAEKGPIETESAPTDGPGYNYTAIETVGAGAPHPTLLKVYYSGTRKENKSEAAATLVKFLDLNCG